MIDLSDGSAVWIIAACALSFLAVAAGLFFVSLLVCSGEESLVDDHHDY